MNEYKYPGDDYTPKDHVRNKVWSLTYQGIRCDTAEVVAIGPAAIRPLISILNDDPDNIMQREAVMECLEVFGKAAVPKLKAALRHELKEKEGEPYQLSRALIRISYKVDDPTIVRELAQSLRHDSIISGLLEQVVTRRVLDLRKIVLERDMRHATEAGLEVVDRAIADMTHLCGGKLPPKLKEELKDFRAQVAAEIKKQEQRTKPRGAKDGETVRLEKPLRRREQIPAPQGRRAFAG